MSWMDPKPAIPFSIFRTPPVMASTSPSLLVNLLRQPAVGLPTVILFMSVPGPSLPTGEQKLLVRSENICAPRRRRSAAAGRRNWSRVTEEGLMNNHHQPPTGALRVAAHAI
eukprot:Tamp_21349.p1 GENE.Tamp_21349~~Tamp_21349.p1  ORF type:complete len:112 (-),score=12.92 Tamp_21349:110-445(-)